MLELVALLALSLSIAEEESENEGASSPNPTQPPDGQMGILQALDHRIDEVQAQDPGALSDWKVMVARIPYLTETVAMYYAAEDPDVPQEAKVGILAALAYAVFPLDIIPDEIPVLGQLDDLAVIWSAVYNFYGYVKKPHLEQAREWLRARGVDPKPFGALGKKE